VPYMSRRCHPAGAWREISGAVREDRIRGYVGL
jgi:hypothetical protein